MVHDHVAGGSGPAAAAAAGHDHGSTGTPGAAGPAVHDHGSTGGSGEAAPAGATGDHHHDPGTTGGAPPVPDGPQGTWTELRYGPFVGTPAGAGGDADHANIAVPTLQKPCTNCFLQQFEPDLVYADGTPANLDTGMMIHHAVLFSAGSNKLPGCLYRSRQDKRRADLAQAMECNCSISVRSAVARLSGSAKAAVRRAQPLRRNPSIGLSPGSGESC